MSSYPATPGEFDRLLEFLGPVPKRHHRAIVRLMFEEVGTCPCGDPVRASDARKLVDGQLLHLACAGSAGGEPLPPSPTSVTYEAGCGCERYRPLVDLYGNERCGLCDRTRGLPRG